MSDGSVVLASGGADSRIGIWSPFNYTLLNQISTHSIRCLKSLGPNTSYLASGGTDFVINIYETKTFTFLRRLTGHSGTIFALDVMQNGYLFSGSNDGLVKIWNLNSGQLVIGYDPLSVPITGVKAIASGLVAIVGEKKTMMFVDSSTSTGYSLTLATGTATLNGALLYNNDQIFVTAYNQKVSLADAYTYTSLREFATTYTTISLEYYPPC